MSPPVAFAVGVAFGAALVFALFLAAARAFPVPQLDPPTTDPDPEPEGEGPLHDRLDNDWFVMSESAIRDVADAAYGHGFGAGRAAGRT